MDRKTIEIIKQKWIIPDAVKQHHKDYLQLRKQIRQVLKEEPETIPGIAKKTGIPSDQVLFVVMTMRKYNEVETGELDDLDEYYFYKLKEK
jgi:hypothetical protein